NQAAANGNHRAVVPDGTLCAGGQTKFAGLDLPRNDWEATPIVPKADGTFDFEFKGTAPHATRDWVFYVTRQGYVPSEPLEWSDLFEFCRLGNVPLSADSRYILNTNMHPVPAPTGRMPGFSLNPPHSTQSEAGEPDCLPCHPTSPWGDPHPGCKTALLSRTHKSKLVVLNTGYHSPQPIYPGE
ncbi:lytic polysaccharide monooxygenase auxiliary activity family 9 protein, partial [Microbulbifer sp. 2205BS26-8]|uniref:lytic polysaccharide monooxygenase auxiliary activity family 9 protein n=1 Tax=Microbulbifer sp. 2205BS26-8 TaxID=3064386 RepID=UPI00273E6D01